MFLCYDICCISLHVLSYYCTLYVLLILLIYCIFVVLGISCVFLCSREQNISNLCSSYLAYTTHCSVCRLLSLICSAITVFFFMYFYSLYKSCSLCSVIYCMFLFIPSCASSMSLSLCSFGFLYVVNPKSFYVLYVAGLMLFSMQSMFLYSYYIHHKVCKRKDKCSYLFFHALHITHTTYSAYGIPHVTYHYPDVLPHSTCY